MAFFDCFNGDADGICALTQLRRHTPRDAQLVTGVKRDIQLLQRIQDEVVAGDAVTALDVSMDKNRSALDAILARGAAVFYCDHHFAGEVPEHDQLEALINTTPDVCTSLLINEKLQGAYRAWAVVGTFGDNLDRSAAGIAKPLNLTQSELDVLRDLGLYLNYNGYGPRLEDLYFDPKSLFERTVQFDSPFDFIAQDKQTFQTLANGYHDDMNHAAQLQAHFETAQAAVYVLPDAAWSRRVSGVFGNDLANRFPERAHAVLSVLDDANYVVSVRAPKVNKQGADAVCRQFATGGGRAAAAGINALPADSLATFIDVFTRYYQGV